MLQDLLNRLRGYFDGKPWYGDALIQKLENITAQQASQKISKTHTIAQIVWYMLQWRTFAIEKLKGNTDYDIKLNSSSDWDQSGLITDEEWSKLISNLKDNQIQLLQLLDNKEESFLLDNVPGKDYTFSTLLNGICEHDVYHLGQIGLIHSQLK